MTMMPHEERHTAENTANWVEKADEKFGFFLMMSKLLYMITLPILRQLLGYLKKSTELHHINVQAIHFGPCSTMPLRRIPK